MSNSTNRDTASDCLPSFTIPTSFQEQESHANASKQAHLAMPAFGEFKTASAGEISKPRSKLSAAKIDAAAFFAAFKEPCIRRAYYMVLTRGHQSAKKGLIMFHLECQCIPWQRGNDITIASPNMLWHVVAQFFQSSSQQSVSLIPI